MFVVKKEILKKFLRLILALLIASFVFSNN